MTKYPVQRFQSWLWFLLYEVNLTQYGAIFQPIEDLFCWFADTFCDVPLDILTELDKEDDNESP